jgi:DNA uptake protein ComE-like DNA-binding protein/sugar-specific transcriptional regulator TrmB
MPSELQRFTWAELSTEMLLDKVCATAGLVSEAVRNKVNGAVAEVLSLVGGPPCLLESRSEGELRSLALKLFEDGLRCFASRQVVDKSPVGFAVVQNGGAGLPCEAEIVPRDRVSVNYCSAGALQSLPGIGESVAEKIVAERKNGFFKDTDDIARRVSGITYEKARLLSPRLNFASNPYAIDSCGSMEALLEGLVNAVTITEGENRIVTLLEAVVAELSSRNGTVWFEERNLFAETMEKTHRSEWVIVLRGENYHRWLEEVINKAERSIDVAMFYMSLPKDQEHPVRRLIGALARKLSDNVKIRVVLDKDRESDPYKSHVINGKAAHHLSGAGIDVRLDQEDRVLHSKLVIVDSVVTVIGSHNWTDGSFGSYDDLSLGVMSATYARELEERFDGIWRSAAPLA